MYRADLAGDIDWRRATPADVLAYRDRVVAAAEARFGAGDLPAGVEALNALDRATIDDRTLQLTDGYLPIIAGSRKIIATFDPKRRPAADEVVIVYGNYPHGFGNVVSNNPIRRHVADFWNFRHDAIESDARWNGIGRIFVINVDARRDRYDAVLRELIAAGAPLERVTRVSAVLAEPEDPGGSGPQAACLRSHIETLRRARECGADHAMVLEDDFSFTSDLDTHLNDLQTFIARRYDYWVCLLATSKYGSIVVKDDLLSMSFQPCTNTAGYLVSLSGVEQVLDVYEAAHARMRATGDYVSNAVDRCWSVLQPSGRFLVFRRKFGFQAASFSDLERAIARYLD